MTAILAHLDTRVILSRSQASKGIYPAVDPLRSDSKLMDSVITSYSIHYTKLYEVDRRVNALAGLAA